MRKCELRQLGRMGYRAAFDLQRRLVEQRKAGLIPDQFLLVEHPHVITLGRNGHMANLLAGEDVLRRSGVEFEHTDRGGDITYHGPGQIVGYPIVRLVEPIDVVAHVRRLEGILIEVLAGFGVEGYRVEGRSGVWVRRLLSEDKIAAIGVRVQRGVTMHGFALNCDNSLLPFSQIIPCGIADAGVTTLSEVLGRDVRPAEVVDAVVAAFQASFAPSSNEVAA